MAEKTVAMNVKLPDSLHAAFIATCRDRDRTASQVLREFMRSYIAKNGQKDLGL